MPRRKSKSRANRLESRDKTLQQRQFRPLCNPYRPMEILSIDQIESIHQTSLRILRDIGLRVESRNALKLLSDLRVEVNFDNNRVCFDPDLIEEMIIGLPSEFTIHARNPGKTVPKEKKKLLSLENRAILMCKYLQL